MQEAYTWKLEVLEQQKVSMAHGKVSNAGAPMAIPTLPTAKQHRCGRKILCFHLAKLASVPSPLASSHLHPPAPGTGVAFAPTSCGVALVPTQGGGRGAADPRAGANMTWPRCAWQAQ